VGRVGLAPSLRLPVESPTRAARLGLGGQGPARRHRSLSRDLPRAPGRHRTPPLPVKIRLRWRIWARSHWKHARLVDSALPLLRAFSARLSGCSFRGFLGVRFVVWVRVRGFTGQRQHLDRAHLTATHPSPQAACIANPKCNFVNHADDSDHHCILYSACPKPK
jgi:hypothetical protein